MFHLIDAVAMMWLNWRIDRETRTKESLAEIKELRYHDNKIQMVFENSSIPLLAEDAARILGDAENYVTFDMIPKLTTGLRPVTVIIKWMDKFSPDEKAAKLEGVLREAIALRPELRELLDLWWLKE